MTLWICFLPLLLLLDVSTPVVSYDAPSQRLCGTALVEALYFVCGDRGFYYAPKRRRRNVKRSIANEEEELPGNLRKSRKRGIVEQCCENICSLLTLESYCDV